MSGVHDELEERRVIRLLDGAAAAAPELGASEVARLLEGARRGRRHTSRRVAVAAHRACLLAPAAAALAAVVLAGGGIPGQAPTDERSPTATTGVVVFPEGSALELLLDHPSGGAT